jgi:adenosine deaminase
MNQLLKSPRSLFFASALLVALCSTAAPAQSPAPAKSKTSAAPQRVESALRAARGNAGTLRDFLVRMPKGADLHIHLSGAVYAEHLLAVAAAHGLCYERPTAKLVAPTPRNPAGADPSKPPPASQPPACDPHDTPAAKLPTDQHNYDRAIDSFSMRNFVPTARESGHDHFFATFDKFGAADKLDRGAWLDELSTRASNQNEQYLEIMETLDDGHGADLGRKISFDLDHPLADDAAGNPPGPAAFTRVRDALLANGLREGIPAARAMLDQAYDRRAALQHCPPASNAPAVTNAPASPCSVQIRFLFQVLRGLPREEVFAQTLLAFELAAAELATSNPRVLGLNYVMPEDGFTSMHDYALQMRWLGWFHNLYPQVHISLHAGELAPGLVPPSGLSDHVRLAVETAHAERIGHAVDTLWESNGLQLAREMAARHIMVEINLTSNDVILNIKGAKHPFPVFRANHVPVALSTDDEGVSRIDLTHEYIRAVEEYDLTYADLKQLARTSLEHSFLPGPSLWAQPDAFTRPVAACSSDLSATGTPVSAKPSTKCARFLSTSPHAQQQWELESRFRAFEASF